MEFLPQIQLLSRYNQWMNQKVYRAASSLNEYILKADNGAFFGSISGTLNHILVADIIWLKRFANHPSSSSILNSLRKLPQPETLDLILYSQFDELNQARQQLDESIVAWCQQLTEADLDFKLPYYNMRGEALTKEFSSLLLHFFNHQTHHRGQVTTLLSQAGVDVGVTDLGDMLPNFQLEVQN